MSWECPCGVANKNNAYVCSGCGSTVEKANEYFSNHPDVKERIKKRPKFLSIAWNAFKRTRGIVILYFFLLLFIKEASGVFFLSDSFWNQKGFTQSDFVVMGIGLLIQSYLYFGILQVALDSVRGLAKNRGRLFIQISDFTRVFVVTTVALIPICIGILLLIIPGIYIALTWSQICLLLLDGKARLFDAFRLSANMTKHKKASIFFAFFVSGSIGVPASILNKALAKPEFALAVGDGLSTILLIIAESWIILVHAFIAFVTAAIYNELLTGITQVSNNEQVESER